MRHAVPRSGAVALCLAIGACAGEPVPVETRAATPVAFSDSGAEPLPDRWWVHLDDRDLDRLIGAALTGNPSLAQTWDRLRQSEAVARRDGAAQYPAIDLDADARGTLDGDGTTGDSVAIGAAASYEVDLWGRVRSAADAARFDASASEAEVHAAAISLSAETADTWYRLIEQRALLDLLQFQIDINEQVLELVELRFRLGQGQLADVLRQRRLVEERYGDTTDVLADMVAFENALAILLGQPPRTIGLPERDTLDAPPPLPATGLPADLLRRRPDIRQAFFDVQAADARLAAAIADQYPRIDLTASLNSAVTNPANLFTTWLASLVGQLTQPLFDAGRRAAEVDRTEAVLSERLNGYEEAVLQALREVEDALVREKRQREKVDSLEAQLILATQTIDGLRSRYTQGATDYLDVLDALSTQQDLARRLVTARRELIGFRIELARALAGGWDVEAPSTRELALGAG